MIRAYVTFSIVLAAAFAAGCTAETAPSDPQGASTAQSGVVNDAPSGLSAQTTESAVGLHTVVSRATDNAIVGTLDFTTATNRTTFMPAGGESTDVAYASDLTHTAANQGAIAIALARGAAESADTASANTSPQAAYGCRGWAFAYEGICLGTILSCDGVNNGKYTVYPGEGCP